MSKDKTEFLASLGKWTVEHFQPGVLVSADSGLPLRDLYATGEKFQASSLDAFKQLCHQSVWWKERSAMSKARVALLGRPSNAAEFQEFLEKRKIARNKQELLSVLGALQAERLALEKEFAARSEELARRD